MNEVPATDHQLSMANEMYLKSIYQVMEDFGFPEEGVRSVDVAEQLNVSKASVNKAISTLRDAGFVEQNRYGKVQLTSEGKNYAETIWRCYHVLRAFLENDLGVDSDTAHAEACLMEHAISTDTMARWTEFLEQQGMNIA